MNRLHKKLGAANAKKAGALSLFHRAADELDEAAEEARLVADAAYSQKRAAEELELAALEDAQNARSNANAIRNLIGA